ncbi:MAG TPA: 7TM diverse intracellular signaling domain-containing protein, partial [Bacteroidales bacterium]|nr:7TM diverse intracellular signaling domain-containing protein [Bacteroidales bacterium]
MKKLLFLLFLSLPLQTFCSTEDPVAKGGILDLRKIENKEHFILKLNGEWEFYWKRMLYPHDFESGKIIPDYFGKVPSYWTDYSKWLKTENFGYATYRLRILLPEGFRSPVAFDLPIFDSSYDIYINGKYIDGNGKTGKSKTDSQPEYRKVFFRYTPDSDVITLIINVSNYHHRRGGFWLPAKIGTFSLLQKHLANSWAANWSVISLLLGCSLLFFFFFIFSNGEIMGFFSMVSTGLALRPLFTNSFLIQSFINIPWVWLIRCEYTDLYFILIGTSWFASKLYPSTFAKALAWGITILSGIAFVFTVFLPVRIFSYFMLVIYPALFIVTGYLIFRSFKAALKNSIVDTIYLIAFMLLLAGGLNDIWVALGRSGSGSGYLLTYMIVVIVIIQASLLIYRWIRSFRETEKLKLEMEYMNRNLEKLIDERTRELQIRNQEIEEQNKVKVCVFTPDKPHPW